jgi:hypothetical protein
MTYRVVDVEPDPTIPVYDEITALDAEEIGYLAYWSDHSEAELLANGRWRQELFDRLWTDPNRPHKELCVACGMPQGFCNNRDCIRTRVTNKLHLNDWMD